MKPQPRRHASRSPKQDYLGAISRCLLIPVAVVAGGVLFRLIDPEWARGHADYAVETLGLTEITSIIRPTSAASIRVAS